MSSRRRTSGLRLGLCLIAVLYCGATPGADIVPPPVEASPAGAGNGAEEAAPGPLEIGQAALLAKDYATAYRALHAAAEQGEAQAQSALGGMFRAGHGVAPDSGEGLRWLRPSA